MPQYTIQQANITSEDIHHVVDIHRQEISQGFLSSLGNKALKLIFSLAVQSKHGVLFIAKDNDKGEVCGFLLGTVDTSKFYKDFLLKKSFKAIIVFLPKLLSVEKIRKVFETLFYPTKKEIPNLPKAELLDIAISRKNQGTGLAQGLFKEFATHISTLGVKEFKITTGKSLKKAHRFYESLGAKKVGSIQVHRGQETSVYKYKIPATAN